MSDSVTGLPGRGQTLLTGTGRTLASTGQSENVEGVTKEFADRDSTSTQKVKPLRSQNRVTMMLVRNVSGIALLPKRVCRWKSGKRGKQVDGYCYVDHEECAGVVDEMLPTAGVPNYDLFWLAVKGPHLIATPLEGNGLNRFSVGSIVTALTAATSQATTAGRVQDTLYDAMTNNQTNAVSVALNYIGRAMTARTTANTGGVAATGYVLVDLSIR